MIITSLSTLLFVSHLYTTESTTDETKSETTVRDALESGGEGPEMVVVGGGNW